ncbi:MAG: helicase HerA-like domain-containing protein, partial [Flavobacteriaceae bacterium]
PREQKAVRTAADTFRPNPEFNTAEVITQLGVGEALVSCLEGKGAPSMVQRTLVRPPSSRLGPISPDERRAIMDDSPVRGLYDKAEDRESAYEILAKRNEDRVAAEAREAELAAREKEAKEAAKQARSGRSRGDSAAEAAIKSLGRSLGTSVGRRLGEALLRGILGSLSRR